MHLILLGPPGAGKGTQARLIATSLKIPQVSTGDIIRATREEDSPLGEKLRSCIGSGRLVADGLVNEMVEVRLAEPDCSQGWLLDGYPRTLPQAEALDRLLVERKETLDHVLRLMLDDAVVTQRITGRRLDPVTGRIYHIEFNPPPSDVIGRLIQRDDDTEEVLARRFQEYREKTALLVPHYRERGLLREIDADGARDEVQARIFAVLGVSA